VKKRIAKEGARELCWLWKIFSKQGSSEVRE
jgi:hypothetical protein